MRTSSKFTSVAFPSSSPNTLRRPAVCIIEWSRLRPPNASGAGPVRRGIERRRGARGFRIGAPDRLDPAAEIRHHLGGPVLVAEQPPVELDLVIHVVKARAGRVQARVRAEPLLDDHRDAGPGQGLLGDTRGSSNVTAQ